MYNTLFKLNTKSKFQLVTQSKPVTTIHFGKGMRFELPKLSPKGQPVHPITVETRLTATLCHPLSVTAEKKKNYTKYCC